MKLETLLEKISEQPNNIEFTDVINTIDAEYTFTETAFTNGLQKNLAGENSGSCKLLSFASLHKLSEKQALSLFGDYYRKDVLENPEGKDHQNIRQFMQHGYKGLTFENHALTPKQKV